MGFLPVEVIAKSKLASNYQELTVRRTFSLLAGRSHGEEPMPAQESASGSVPSMNPRAGLWDVLISHDDHLS